MGRPRAFDEDAVLTGAMEVFRKKGYLAVSIKDLAEATGLKSGSIYHAYGDKDGLFRAAMAHYNRVVLDARIGEHASKEAGLDGLRRLFVSLMHEPNDGTFGCLITNTAIELGGGHRVPADVDAGLRTLHALFLDRLRSAQRRATPSRRMPPVRGAIRLLSLYQGILVLVRAGWDKGALEVMVNDEFDRLEKGV